MLHIIYHDILVTESLTSVFLFHFVCCYDQLFSQNVLVLLGQSMCTYSIVIKRLTLFIGPLYDIIWMYVWYLPLCLFVIVHSWYALICTTIDLLIYGRLLQQTNYRSVNSWPIYFWYFSPVSYQVEWGFATLASFDDDDGKFWR